LFIGLVLVQSFASSLLLGAGRTSNGGDVVIDWSYESANPVMQLYSLDLAEYGLAKIPYEVAKRSVNSPFPGEVPLPDYKLFKIHATGTQAYWWFFDTENRRISRTLNDSRLIHDTVLRHTEAELWWNIEYEVGLLNLLYEIRKTSPEYADRILSRIKQLTWIFADSRLEPISDENSPISTKLMYQIARNDDGEVRIARQGWSDRLEPLYECRTDKSNYAVTLDYTNKTAVVFHEVLYSFTKEQGDTDSKRARKANALLFTRKPENIEKSFKLIFPN